MSGASKIKAGEAFWEVTIRDKYAKGLKLAQGKMAAFAAGVKAIGTAAAVVGSAVAAGVAAIATGVIAVVSRSISTFLSISEQLRMFTGEANPKAVGLTNAWGEFKAVLSAVFYLIGEAVAGPLTKLIQMFTAASLAAIGFVKVLTSGGIVGAFATITFAITALWEAMLIGLQDSLLKAIKVISGVFKATVTMFVAPIKALEQALGRDLGSGAIEAAASTAGAIGLGGFEASIQADATARSAKLMGMIAALSGMFVGGGSASDQADPRLAHLTGSQGTFSSRGAGMLGVGPGGGMKTSDDETHKQLERVIAAIRGIMGPEFK